MTPAEQARVFADALLGDHGEALNGLQITVTRFTSDKSLGPRTLPVSATADQLASAVLSAAAERGIVGVYVGVGLTRGARAIDPATGKRYKRLAKSDVDGLAWLWCDIDIAGAAHGHSKPLAPDKDTAIAIAMSTGLPPTLIVDTGHGIQAHWRLSEPFIYGAVDVDLNGVPIIDESRVEADRKAGEELAWSWVTSLRVRAKRMGGYYVDPTTDPSRLVRAPGSTNCKVAGDHRRVFVLEHNPSYRYDLEDLRAAFAPESLLAPFRREDDGDASATLAGVDLVGLWNAARAYPDHEPPWLRAIIDSGWADDFAEVWSGAAHARYGNDENAVDMAVVAYLLHMGRSVEEAAEAVMCRRLQVNIRVEKVDPAQRARYYLNRTIGRVAGGLRAKEAELAPRVEAVAAAVDTADDGETDDLQVGSESGDEVPLPPEPQEDPDEAPTPVVAADSTSNVTPLSLEVLRSDPDGDIDPEVEHADAPIAPRQGIEGPTPRKMPQANYRAGAALGAQLGLPRGITVWQVGIRKLTGVDEFRLWLHRDRTTTVHGGDWRPNTVGATRWHPKPDWRARDAVAELLLEDLHLVADVDRGWTRGGRHLMYQLAQKMPGGTPEDVIRLAVLSSLRRTAGTARFATAVASRDPWVAEGEVWLPLTSVRESIRQMGFKAYEATVLVDTLGSLRCKVRSEMEIVEGNRTISDFEQWAMVPDLLMGPVLAAEVTERATDRDATDARAEIRALGT